MSDDWEIGNSDEDSTEDYMPDPETIIHLYNKLKNGELPELKCKIIPRNLPVPKTVESEPIVEDIKEKSPGIEVNLAEDMEPNEFDFDDQAVNTVKRFTPRRTPNRPQTKTVASMDKVCSNIIKYQKMDAEQQKKELK